MPALLSAPKAPMRCTTYWMSSSVTSRDERVVVSSRNLAWGSRPRSRTTSSSSPGRLSSPKGSAMCGGSFSMIMSRSLSIHSCM